MHMNFFQMIAVLLFGTSTPTDRLEGTVFYYLMAFQRQDKVDDNVEDKEKEQE